MTIERTFDRLVQFDERSRAYGIREVVAGKPRAYTHNCNFWLDQGREGACVGFAWAHELGAKPVVVAEASNELALSIYREAQKIDEWEGENYSGTSVIAGAKAAQAKGYIQGYRWAFGLDDLILAVGRGGGPAVLGVNWYSGMFDTDSEGYIHVTGSVQGGHAILCRALDVKKRRFLLHNSWGRDWGRGGTAWISYDDMERLLHEQGEACIPTIRRKK